VPRYPPVSKREARARARERAALTPRRLIPMRRSAASKPRLFIMLGKKKKIVERRQRFIDYLWENIKVQKR